MVKLNEIENTNNTVIGKDSINLQPTPFQLTLVVLPEHGNTKYRNQVVSSNA